MLQAGAAAQLKVVGSDNTGPDLIVLAGDSSFCDGRNAHNSFLQNFDVFAEKVPLGSVPAVGQTGETLITSIKALGMKTLKAAKPQLLLEVALQDGSLVTEEEIKTLRPQQASCWCSCNACKCK
jgi:hypothetical protein